MKRKENGRIGKLLRGSVTVLLAAILIFNLAVLLLQYRNGTDFFRSAPAALLQVQGGSMEPVLHAGDAILVRQTPISELRRGDIIVFCRGNELVVHEVLTADDGAVVTKGTANPSPDEPVTESEYRARLLCRIPLLGVIWKFCSGVPMFLMWTLLLALLLFGTDIFSALYEQLQKRKNRTDNRN